MFETVIISAIILSSIKLVLDTYLTNFTED